MFLIQHAHNLCLNVSPSIRRNCSNQWHVRYVSLPRFSVSHLIEHSACTSVVTQISYHEKNTIDATITFLSAEDWHQELVTLLQELKGFDDTNDSGRSITTISDNGIAWAKVSCLWLRVDSSYATYLPQLEYQGPRCVSYSHPRRNV